MTGRNGGVGGKYGRCPGYFEGFFIIHGFLTYIFPHTLKNNKSGHDPHSYAMR